LPRDRRAGPCRGDRQTPKETNAVARDCRPDPKARNFYQFGIYSDRYARLLTSMYGAKYGLSFSDWRIMAVLGVRAPMSATEAGKLTSLKPDQVTRTVDSLVAKGYVLRSSDKEDRRRVVLILSAKGIRTFHAVDKLRYAVECEMLAGLDAAELRTLGTILEKIRRQTEQMSAEKRTWQDILADHEAEADAGPPRLMSSTARA
jgi:DNA-binding MarR family transcriptional regulator